MNADVANAQNALVKGMREQATVVERLRTLFDAIKHGDADHQAWLKEAIDAHFAGHPVPEPRGKGKNEALIEAKDAKIQALREALTRVRDHAIKLRKGTDDWFELAEIEAMASTVLQTDGGPK